ncbi:MAG: tetratricopeptide repeat protein [Archangium sp.]|nr:tetratricopeptide repeat protein [Archangium sp.]
MAFSTRTELALGVALLLVAGVAHADEVEVRARAAALEGKKAFDTNDFVKAISKYEEAYRLKPAPGLLFNLAQSHRKAGHLDEALSYFKRYLETNPAKPQADAVETLITQTEAERAEKEASAEQAAKEAKEREARAEQERLAKEASARALQVEHAKLAVKQAEAEAASRRLELERALQAQEAAKAPPPVYQRWWFWGAIGVVVAGAVTTSVAVATAPQPAPTTFPDINAR